MRSEVSEQRVIIGLELQVPFHSEPIWKSFLNFVDQFQPHRIVGIGDHLDCPAPARWNRGTAAEYAGDLQGECNLMKRKFQEIRNIFVGEFEVHKGNHEQRVDMYAANKAPAFAGLDALQVSALLDYEGFDITELPAVAPLAPGWVTTHGDVSRSLSKYAGGTALGLGRRWGLSVVCGHTHRLGHIQESSGFNSRHTLHGIETGHMMDVKKASYIKDGAPNWQSGFVAFVINGRNVHPILVNASQSGKLTYDGA